MLDEDGERLDMRPGGKHAARMSLGDDKALILLAQLSSICFPLLPVTKFSSSSDPPFFEAEFL